MNKLIGALLFSAVIVQSVRSQDDEPSSGPKMENQAGGMADIVRANAMARLLEGQAALQIEGTRQLYVENQRKAFHGYLELRRQSKVWRDSQRSFPLSREQYDRGARQQAPNQLSSTQLDPLTGQIAWPAVLTKADYAPMRQRIDRLFAERASGSAAFGEIPAAISPFLARLKADIALFSANDYLQGRQFLEALQMAGRGIDN